MLATNTTHALGTDVGAWLTLVACGLAIIAVTIATSGAHGQAGAAARA